MALFLGEEKNRWGKVPPPLERPIGFPLNGAKPGLSNPTGSGLLPSLTPWDQKNHRQRPKRTGPPWIPDLLALTGPLVNQPPKGEPSLGPQNRFPEPLPKVSTRESPNFPKDWDHTQWNNPITRPHLGKGPRQFLPTLGDQRGKNPNLGTVNPLLPSFG